MPFRLLILSAFLVQTGLRADPQHTRDSLSGAGTRHSDSFVTDTYQFELVKIDRLDARFEYSLGSVTLGPGPRQRVEGSIRYHPDEFAPSVTYDTFGNEGLLVVKVKSPHGIHYQGDRARNHSPEGESLRDIKTRAFHNEMDFSLPPGMPTRLDLDLGLGEAVIDLNRLSISGFMLDCGLSDVRIDLSTPNPVPCDEIDIKSGLGDLNAYGLGYLQARRIRLDVGLGSAEADLTAQQVDLKGDFHVGLGAMDVRLPKKANYRIKISDSFLSSVDINSDGTLEKTGDDMWISREWKAGRPTIELKIEVGLGSVDIDLRD